MHGNLAGMWTIQSITTTLQKRGETILSAEKLSNFYFENRAKLEKATASYAFKPTTLEQEILKYQKESLDKTSLRKHLREMGKPKREIAKSLNQYILHLYVVKNLHNMVFLCNELLNAKMQMKQLFPNLKDTTRNRLAEWFHHHRTMYDWIFVSC